MKDHIVGRLTIILATYTTFDTTLTFDSRSVHTVEISSPTDQRTDGQGDSRSRMIFNILLSGVDMTYI